MAERVMCMDDGPITPRWFFDPLVCGQVYSVRGVTRYPDYGNQDTGMACFYLCGMSNGRGPDGKEIGYGQWRFHPIRDSAIEIFREIARNPHRELEDA